MDENVLMPCPPSCRDKHLCAWTRDVQIMAQLAKAVAVKEEAE